MKEADFVGLILSERSAKLSQDLAVNLRALQQQCDFMASALSDKKSVGENSVGENSVGKKKKHSLCSCFLFTMNTAAIRKLIKYTMIEVFSSRFLNHYFSLTTLSNSLSLSLSLKLSLTLSLAL